MPFRETRRNTDAEKASEDGDETRYSSDLHHPLYKSLCTDYHAGKEGTKWEGTNDESAYHLSCLFAQYLNYNFGRSSNREVILVGHSLGGIIMRETLFQMQEHAGQSPFPDTIGHVTKAITFNTPHGGPHRTLGRIACGGCKHSAEVDASSELMQELRFHGRNPQTSAGFTEWTVIGSECDLVMRPNNSIDMDASHAIVYPKEGLLTCYDHSKALHDANLKRDANQFYCDTDNPVNSPCGTDYRKTGNTRWNKTGSGRHGLSQLYYSITGGAERAGSSRRLWLLSTTVTAWALLRR